MKQVRFRSDKELLSIIHIIAIAVYVALIVIIVIQFITIKSKNQQLEIICGNAEIAFHIQDIENTLNTDSYEWLFDDESPR
ncbi:MAG: hypothetical protein EGQ20_07140 [Bacteroides oleiciplenus]|nr:hypothetical protein [Bacteroides oleiciplenus]